jgi:diguanylate cyclase (GGDEF)-like protein
MNYKKTSNSLIALSIALIVIGLLSLVFIYHAITSLEHDAKAINLAGVVRGGIQRLSKLELDKAYGDTLLKKNDIIDQIDQNVIFLSRYPNTRLFQSINPSWIEQVVILENLWNKYKITLDRYHNSATEENSKALFLKSEEAWYVADKTVLMSQVHTEGKIREINILYILVFLSILSSIMVLITLYRKVRNRLEYDACFDCLTGLLNRHCYTKEIEEEVSRSHGLQCELSLILFDIDNFKQVNDKFGHNVGDKVLIAVGNVVKARLRKSDSLFRIGGEEFAIICSDTGVNKALQLADKIRVEVSKYAFDAVDHLTLSFGIAGLDNVGNSLSLFNKADSALFVAKKSGKNLVKCYQNEPTNVVHFNPNIGNQGVSPS